MIVNVTAVTHCNRLRRVFNSMFICVTDVTDVTALLKDKMSYNFLLFKY